MAFNIGDKVRPRFCVLNKDKIGEVIGVDKYDYKIIKFPEYEHETFHYMDKELIKQGDLLLSWLRDGK